MNRAFKIGVAGTHSTGKTTFVNALRDCLQSLGFKVGHVDDLARRAQELGFPILREHTFESTLWIMADCMRQEAEQSLSNDIILVDRPVPDALGYLHAALDITGRTIADSRLQMLDRIARVYTANYDILVVTVLNPLIPLGPGRDDDPPFREAAATSVFRLIDEVRPDVLKLNSDNSEEIIETIIAKVSCNR